MLKGVIFDMDGLMIDTEKLLTRFWCEAANHYGYPMTKEHVLGIRSLAAKYAIPHLKGIFGEDFDYYKVRGKRIELMNEFIRQNGIEKKKGLDELLDYLDGTGLKKAVATATDLQRTTLYLSSINIIDRFDKLICGNMIETASLPLTFISPPQRSWGLTPASALPSKIHQTAYAPPTPQAASLL